MKPTSVIALLRRDALWRGAPFWALWAIVLGVMLAGVVGDVAGTAAEAGSRVDGRALLYARIVGWQLLSLALAIAGITTRCSPLDATLPVPARRLWLARILGLALVPFVVITLALGVAAVLGAARIGQPQPSAPLARIALDLLATALLALAVVQLYRPGRREITVEGRTLTVLLIVWIAHLALLFGLAATGPLGAFVALAAAIGLLTRAYLRHPATFAEAARAATEPAAEAPAGAAPSTRGQTRISLWRMLWRFTTGHWLFWIVAPVLTVFGIAIFDPAAQGGSQLLIVPVYITLLGAMIGRLHTIDPLPIGRRAIFPFLGLPGLAAIFLGYGIAATVLHASAAHRPLIECADPSSASIVRVASAYWEVGRLDHLPSISAPWGERQDPPASPLVGGGRSGLYSPYAADATRTPAFVALQLSRAIAKVYGAHIAPDELERRYLEPDADGRVRVKAGGFTLLRDYPSLRAPAPWGRLRVLVLITGTLWFLMLALALRGMYSRGRGPLSRVFMLAFVVIVVAGSLGAVFLALSGQSDAWRLSIVLNILLRRFGEWLPGPALVQWGATLVVVTLAYRLALRQFERLELPLVRIAR